MKEAIKALTWEELSQLTLPENSYIEGPNTPYAFMRLFGKKEEDIRVVLYRDNHAWCPYCQKVWLWLEWKQIPYLVKKASMRCYGQKEWWYLKKVPSGMFPAIELDQQVITESDRILFALENIFGPLGMPLNNPATRKIRQLERTLFGSWCQWLCTPSISTEQELKKQKYFQFVANEMDNLLSQTNGPWLDKAFNDSGNIIPGSSDIVFIPYLERMNASLAYYKGFNLRKEFPHIDQWFRALEQSDVYRGTQGDFHTHAHDLPPQMGGCWTNKTKLQEEFVERIDSGEGLGEMETSFKEAIDRRSETIALSRVVKHHIPILRANSIGKEEFDQPLRAALTKMILGKPSIPNKGSAIGLRYLKDRISVPRDMPILSARKLRQALEQTATIDGTDQGSPIPTKDRFDQDPNPFRIN